MSGTEAPVAVAARGIPHRADVQGLRAVAVLAVVAYHAGLPVRGGFVGVDVFFVISGFVIGSGLLEEGRRSGRVDWRDFLARRARRILPLLGLVVLVTLVVVGLLTDPYGTQQVAGGTGLAAMAVVANLHLYRSTGYFDAAADEANPLLHLWSLSAEEQMYGALLVGAVLVLGAARRRGTQAARVGAVVATSVAAASFALSAALAGGLDLGTLQAPARFGFFSMPSRIWEVLVGVGVAAAAPRLRRTAPGAGSALAAVGLALLVVGILTTDPLAPFPGPAAIPPVAGTALVIAGGTVAAGATRWLGAAPLAWVGDRSFGWYLWHWPALVLVALLVPSAGSGWAPVVALASLGLAAATHVLVERPIRRAPRSRSATLRLALVCTLVPAALALAVDTSDRHGWGVEVPEEWSVTPVGSSNGCLVRNRDLPNDWDAATCTWVQPGTSGLVLVLGDTWASSIYPGVAEAARREGLASAESTRAGCPFGLRAPVGYPRCEEWQREAVALVVRLRPDVVVVANRSPDYVTVPRPGLGEVTHPPVRTAGGRRPGSLAAAERSWAAGLGGGLDRVRALGIPVVLVASGPDFGRDFPRPRVSVLRPAIPEPRLERRTVEDERRTTDAVEAEVLAGRRDVSRVDPLDALCTATACPAVRDGRWWYLDPDDLTFAGAIALADVLEEGLEQTLSR